MSKAVALPRRVKIALSGVIFVITLLMVEFLVGWSSVLAGFTRLERRELLSLSGLMVLSYGLRALRSQVSLHLPRRFFALLHLTTSHNLLNILLPMRSGEVAYPLLMKQHFAVPYLKSSAHLLLFRILDLLALVSIAAAILLWQAQPLWLIALFLGLALTFALLDVGKRQVLIWLEPRPGASWQHLRAQLASLPTQGIGFIQVLVLTGLIWLSKILAFVLLVLALADMPLYQATLAVVGADLSSVLPIHGLAGSGTFEGAFVLAGQLGPADAALLLKAGTQLHLFLLAMALTAFVISWLALRLSALSRRGGQG